MCGIYGIISKNGTEINKDALYQMGLLSALRGTDSTGLCLIKKNGDARIIKTIGPVMNLYYEKGWKKFEEEFKDAVAVFGHCRYATVGDVDKKNAQPLVNGNLILLHNGTLPAVKTEKGESDSTVFCKKIKEMGIKDAVKSTAGSMAIVTYDLNDKKVTFYRNYQRPLSYANTQNFIYVMSERSALEYLFTRNNIRFDDKSDFDDYTLYHLDINNPAAGIEKGDDLYVSVTRKESHTNFFPVFGKGSWIDLSPYYKEGEEINFIVESIFESAQKGQYIYMCSDENNRSVFFKTDKKIDTLIGKTGNGECCSVVTHNTRFMYQVKYRSIIWDDKEPDDDEDEVVTLDELIPRKQWLELVKKEECSGCNRSILPDEHYNTMVWEDVKGKWHLLCGDCYNRSTPVANNERVFT
jgi:predicted glutamine amidotransferase